MLKAPIYLTLNHLLKVEISHPPVCNGLEIMAVRVNKRGDHLGIYSITGTTPYSCYGSFIYIGLASGQYDRLV